MSDKKREEIQAHRQGDFNFGASSQAVFILNYFLSKFFNFPQISSQIFHSFQPGWQTGTIKATLHTQWKN